MKFKALLFLILCLFFFNCTSSDNDITVEDNPNIVPSSKKLIKKISIGEEVFDFIYLNGEVSEMIKNSGEKYIFEYNGDKITRLYCYNSDGSYSYRDYTYDQNHFTSQLYKDGEKEDTFDFYLTPEGLLYKMVYMNFEEYNYSYINKNITTITTGQQQTIMDYDTKFNPFTNHNLYFKIIFNDFIYQTLSENNPIKTKYIWDNKYSQTISYEITYDQDNFPTTIVGKDSSDLDSIYVEYSFEYTE